MFAFVLALAAVAVVSGQQVRDNGVPVPAAAPAPPRDGLGIAVPSGTGVIAGRVMHRDNPSLPVRRAFVTLMVADVARRMAVTDDDGRFWFGGLPAGRYTIWFRKVAYAGTMYGAQRARVDGVTIVLADGQRLTDLAQTMVRGSVVTGRVVDENNVPVTGASVTVFERVMVSGKPVFRPTQAGAATTDDRGGYRFYGFEPGEWIVGVRYLGYPVSNGPVHVVTADEARWAAQGTTAAGAAAQAGPAPARPIKFARVFAPGVVDPTAATVYTWAIGDEKSGVDIIVPFVPTARVSGHVTRSDGGPLTGGAVTANSTVLDNPIGPAGQRALIAADGTFSMEGLEPGTYQLTVGVPTSLNPTGPINTGWWALQEIRVAGQDLSGVDLALQPAMTIPGRVVFDATLGTPPPNLQRVNISLRPAPDTLSVTGGGGAAATADGTFSLAGLAPGTYIFSANVPTPAWVAQSAMMGGRDVIDDRIEIRSGASLDLEVHFTDRPTELDGSIVDQAGKPVSEYSVIVFGTNRANWRQASRWVHIPVHPGSDGRFAITGMPPGEYYLAALRRFDQAEWYTPEFLDQIAAAGALHITLAAGTKTVQDLRVQ